MKSKTVPLIVVDTNILVSAFILPNSITRQAFDKALNNNKIVFSRTSATEFTEVLLRSKFDKYLSLEERLESINILMSVADIVEPNITITASRDKKDDQFLELAVAVNAKCIISGDKDLLVLHPFQNILILSPFDFLNYEFDSSNL